MLTTKDLLAAVRARHNLPSNYALAKFLDVREKDVSRWQNGHNVPTDATIVRLADLAGVDPAAALAALHAQACTDAALRSVWAAMAARLQQVGAVMLTAILSAVVVGTPDAQARVSTQDFAPVSVPASISQMAYRRVLHRAFSHLRGMLQRLAAPMVAPCST